jgi:hypothetical protein
MDMKGACPGNCPNTMPSPPTFRKLLLAVHVVKNLIR